MSIRFHRILPLLALTLGACDTDAPSAPPVDVAALVPSGAAQVVLQRDAGPGAGEETYTLRVIARQTPIASYQGAVRFAPGTIELVSVTTPESPDGEQRLVNPQMAEGRIRFAAFATEQFGSDVVFRFVVRRGASLENVQFAAGLDVAGLVSGQAMTAAQLRATDGVRDAASGRLLEEQ